MNAWMTAYSNPVPDDFKIYTAAALRRALLTALLPAGLVAWIATGTRNDENTPRPNGGVGIAVMYYNTLYSIRNHTARESGQARERSIKRWDGFLMHCTHGAEQGRAGQVTYSLFVGRT